MNDPFAKGPRRPEQPQGNKIADWFRDLTGRRNGEASARNVLEELIEERAVWEAPLQ